MLGVFCSLLFLAACTGTHRLPKGQNLLVKSKLRLENNGNRQNTSLLKTELENIVAFPRPNRHFLGFRTGVWFYTHSRKGTWFNRKFGRTPVLCTPEQIEQTEKLLLNRAFNHGWLDASVKNRTRTRPWRRKAKVRYTVSLGGPPYRLREIQLPDSTDLLSGALRDLAPLLSVRTGQPYNLENLKTARELLARRLRNDGFYFFSAEQLLFQADSNRATRSIDLRLTLKPETPPEAKRRFRIGQISIFPDFLPANRPEELHEESMSACISLKYKDLNIRPRLLLQAVSLQCGDYFSERAYESTLSQLGNLRVFSAVNVRFVPSPGSDTLLDAQILLAPLQAQNIELSGGGLFSPNFYAGAAAKARYSNRNLFRGAEILRFSPGFDYLWLTDGGESTGLTSLQTSKFQVDLERPRFSGRKNKTTLFAPLRTGRVSVAYEHTIFQLPTEPPDFERYDFRLHKLRVEGGTMRQRTRFSDWSREFTPASVTYSTFRFRPALFQETIDYLLNTDSSFLLFAPQLEITPHIGILYDSRNATDGRKHWYFRDRLRFKAGGYLLADSTLQKFGSPFIFHLTHEIDLRRYVSLGPRTVWAMRGVFYTGLPLNQASVKRFRFDELYTVGGGNSMRAFAPRSIGPGSSADSTASFGVGMHTGNMLLEGNMELRRRMFGSWETALFLDVGNIWNTNKDDLRPGAEFRLRRFYRELAVGTGFGLRYYFSFIVLRLDFAAPLRTPSFPAGERWTQKFPAWRDWRIGFSFGHAF